MILVEVCKKLQRSYDRIVLNVHLVPARKQGNELSGRACNSRC